MNSNRNISYNVDINKISYPHAVYNFLAMDIDKDLGIEERKLFSTYLTGILSVMETFHNGLRVHWTIRKGKCKQLKEISVKVLEMYGCVDPDINRINNFLNKEHINGNPFADNMRGLINVCMKCHKKSRDILIPSLCRMYEFYYLSHSELNERKKNLINRMEIYSEDPINMRDVKESVYKDFKNFDSFNHLNNLKRYKGDIEKYLNSKGICHRVNLDMYAQNICEIRDMIKRYSFVGIEYDNDSRLPCKELFPFIKFYELSGEFNKILDDARNGILRKESVKSKDSGSIFNEHNAFLQYMSNRYGQYRVSNIEGNWILGESNILNIKNLRENNRFAEFIPGYNIDFLSIDLGLGDAFKERVVGEPATIFQSILAPLTDIYKKKVATKDKYGNERSFCIATYDIESRLNSIERCLHAISYDYTGYSDYLSRAFICFMLEILGITEENARFIITIFSMPLKVQNRIFDILFGTLQGVEFNFTCITLANLFFSLQAKVYYNSMFKTGLLPSLLTLVQGDDKIIVSLQSKIPNIIKDYNIIFAVYANCVINPDKTEDSEETGNYVFCKVRKRVDGSAISGLSGNIMLKQKKFVSDISTVISQLRKVNYNLTIEQESNIITYLTKRCRDNIIYSYRSLDKLDNEQCETLLKLSSSLPIEVGGLMVDELSSSEYIQICKRALNSALSNSFQVSNKIMSRLDKFSIISELAEMDGPQIRYKDKRLQHLVETTFTNGKEVLTLLRECDEVLEMPYIPVGKFKELKQEIRKIFNIMFKEMSNSNAISTKDRVDPIRNQDLILVKSLSDDIVIEDIKDFLNSEERIYKEIRRLMISDRDIHSDIDLPAYIDLSRLLNYYGSSFKPYEYNAFGNWYIGLIFTGGKLDGKILRLDSDNDYYKGSRNQFATPYLFDSENHYFMIKNFLYRKYKSGSLDLYVRTRELKYEIIEQKIMKDIRNDIFKSFLRDSPY